MLQPDPKDSGYIYESEHSISLRAALEYCFFGVCFKEISSLIQGRRETGLPMTDNTRFAPLDANYLTTRTVLITVLTRGIYKPIEILQCKMIFNTFILLPIT